MYISIIEKFLNELVVKDLKLKCKNNKIKGVSKCLKRDIIKILVEFYASVLIQRKVREYIYKNSVCPISLEIIRYPCWGKKTKTGIIYYNLNSLRDNILIGGNFFDPSTREEYTDDELKSIDLLYKQNTTGISTSVLNAKKRKRHYKEIKERDETIDITVSTIRRYICFIRDGIEKILIGEENINRLSNKMEGNYFRNISEHISILDGLCKRSRNNCFMDIERIINLVETYDVHEINCIKRMVLNWIKSEKEKYNR